MIGGLLAVCLLLAEPVPVPTGTESAPPARTGTETVLAFALGRRCDDGRPSLVLYEVLNQREPLTYAYQPDTGSGTDELAAVNRCLDDAGFQTDAVRAEGLTSTGEPDASPLARWLAAKVPHDDQWGGRLRALLTTGR